MVSTPRPRVALFASQYNTRFVEQVKAMEERATALGMPSELYYLWPSNGPYLNATDLAKAEALGLGEHLVIDVHSLATGATALAEKLFAGPPKTTAAAINCETNAQLHTMARAMTEAVDLNSFFNHEDPAAMQG